MDTLNRDLRHAIHSLRRAPGFSTAVLLILALGIGMSTAMFTVFKTALVDRLPVREQDRVVVMNTLDQGGRTLDVPYPYLSEIARDSALFRGVAGVYHLGAWPEPFMDGVAAVVLLVAATSTNYFDVLGTRPVIGRFFRTEDGQPGAPPVIVLSHAAWRRDFGGDPSIVGRSLVIPYTQERARIVGIAPVGFEYPAGADVWRPIPDEASALQVGIVARLAPDVTIDMARDGLFTLTQRANPFAIVPSLATQLASWEISGVAGQSFEDTVLGGSRRPLVALSLAVALLLLIACVNIGNLSLVRLLGRNREIAVRRAIGARTRDVVRPFVTEHALLGMLGGVLGLAAAMALLRIVRTAVPSQLPRIDALDSFGAPLAVASGITLFALLICGVLPGLAVSRIRSFATLRSGSRSGTAGRWERRTQHGLVAMQIAMTVVMLSGAGLLLRTLAQLESVDLGYRSDHLSILKFTAPQGTLPAGVAGGEVGKQLVRRLEATPGVVGVTPILSEPFIGQSLYMSKLARLEQPVTERERSPFVPYEFGGPSYFHTFAIPIIRGRGFAASDTRDSERIVVVNETLASQLWPDQDPLGKRLVSVAGATGDAAFTVVGVASDTRFRELRNVGPVAYFVWEQVLTSFPGIVAVRTTRPLNVALPGLRTAVQEFNPALVLWDARTMVELLDAPLAQPRLSALLLASFSFVALLLSAVGLYGVVAWGVRRQTRDIGIRVALGAVPGDIRRLVLAQVFGLVGIGLVAGLTGALVASRLVRSILFEVSPVDPLTIAAVCVLLPAVATLAGCIPARRATRIQPIEAVRAD